MESVAATLKRLTLELGGNDAAIVLDDVDVKEAAPKIFAAAMSTPARSAWPSSASMPTRASTTSCATNWPSWPDEAVVDDGLKQGTNIGPMQNKTQYEKVKGFIEDARANGKIIAGGEALDREATSSRPTIVRDIADDARLVREEQFGPVLPVLPFEDLDDAIARTNDTEYGLGGTVWTPDVERGFAVASHAVRHGLGEQAPGHALRRAVPRRQAVRLRRRERSGRPGRVHPGQDHQRRALRTVCCRSDGPARSVTAGRRSRISPPPIGFVPIRRRPHAEHDRADRATRRRQIRTRRARDSPPQVWVNF